MPEQDFELSQAYRAAAHPEPSPALDAHILAAARQAVLPPELRQPQRRRSWFNWAVPLSSMAVLVLGISLLFRMQQDAPETLIEARSALPSKPLEQAEKTPSQTTAPVVPSFGLSAIPSATPPATAVAPVQRRAVPLHDSVQTEAAEVVVPPAPALAAAQANRLEAAPAAPVFSQSMQRMKSAAPAVERSVARSAERSAEQVMPAVTANTAMPLSETPEQGVEAIRLLLRQGNIEAARTQLEALRKRYPGFTLPPDLEPARCCPLP